MIEVSAEGVHAPEGAEELIKRTVAAALRFEHRTGDVTVLLTTPEEIRRMNATFRHVDRVTDVLTFPAWEGESLIAPPDGYLGDIAICLDRAKEQAEDYGHGLNRELGFLAVHGALHLMGYDHMTSEDEAVMVEKQQKILEGMGLYR